MMPVDLLRLQYSLVQGSRQALFAYCETITNDDFNRKIEGFGFGSISSLLHHVAITYTSWLQNFGLGKNIPYIKESDITNVAQARTGYQQVDLHVDEFLNTMNNDLQNEITRYVARHNRTLTLSPLKLFTHVITHEYHHKGQILSMSRHLGYTPVDTDAIRF